MGTTKYLTAPAGTVTVRYQTVFHAGTLGGGGSVYFDDLSLLAKPPANIATSISSGSVWLSFLTQAATSFQVPYKNNLTDPSWQVLQTVSGDGTVKTVTDPQNQTKRFYLVETL